MAGRKRIPWRLPFGAVPVPAAPVSADQRAGFPALRERFTDLDDIVVPEFVDHDAKALIAQRRHRRFQLVLIVGAALTSIFGALQGTVGGSEALGIVVAVLGLSTSFVIARQRKNRPLSRHLAERAKAEELRSLYFRYLSGTGPSDADGLRAEVGVIVADKGVAGDE